MEVTGRKSVAEARRQRISRAFLAFPGGWRWGGAASRFRTRCDIQKKNM
jgi:hypothetical protein